MRNVPDEQDRDRFVSFSQTLHPSLFGDQQLPLAMIGIYADESESESPNVFTIAGWMAAPSAWDRLREPWMKLLSTTGPSPVSALHMKDLTPDPPKGEFAGWTRTQRDALVVGAVELLVGENRPISNL